MISSLSRLRFSYILNYYRAADLLLSSLCSSVSPLQNPNFNTRSLSFYHIVFSPSSPLCNYHRDPPPTSQFLSLSPSLRTKTPLEKQFETWIDHLKPGFTTADVETALRAQSDPDLALDIFRWTAQQRHYRHDAATYLIMIEMAADNRRYGHAETLIEEVVAGACTGTPALYNYMIQYCCSHRYLFNRAFDIFKKMQKLPNCKPSLETYKLLLNCLLRRFNRLNVSYVYLHAVRSLTKQMKASGVIPDTYTLNLVINAYAKCLEMDEALRSFREMGLYACEPNDYTYSCITKGLCEKGRIAQGVQFYKEMRDKGFVPSSSTFMTLICTLSLERRFGEAIEVLYDMLENSKVPDLLTYRTLLEGLCRERREKDALRILKELRTKEGLMNGRTYSNLLDSLHLHSQE
ncbi:pentatricopeptide repeat-containing protein At3g25210, mitochondrial [Aristolochia californica]|uniref:pentatricopeptide repeat-containing protein At3g25210, mitochondrial n=1 Tax=Aristolochia californica TaxID=171875 RepID=UPI0035D609CA